MWARCSVHLFNTPTIVSYNFLRRTSCFLFLGQGRSVLKTPSRNKSIVMVCILKGFNKFRGMNCLDRNIFDITHYSLDLFSVCIIQGFLLIFIIKMLFLQSSCKCQHNPYYGCGKKLNDFGFSLPMFLLKHCT